MLLTKDELNNFKEASSLEWLITNGLGSYASSTVIGVNSRRYHGLMISSLKAPSKRNLILSKLDESITIGNEKYNLYTNQTTDSLSTGYRYQYKFTFDGVPKFKYKVKDVILSKYICFEYGKNTIYITYKIRNGKEHTKFTLAPLLNFRDFHSTIKCSNLLVNQNINKDNVIDISINNNLPIKIWTSDARYTTYENDYFRGMYYKKDVERGFLDTDDHVVPGVFEVDIKPFEAKHITFICSLEDEFEKIDGYKKIEIENKRFNNIEKQAGYRDDLVNVLVRNTDNFIVKRKQTNLHTLIAGYPWFLDWGRDSLISLEGLLLKTKRFDIAKEVLLTYSNSINKGLVPNGFSEYNDTPLYNSVDASLLLFEDAYKYIKYTSDYDFIFKEIFPKLKEIIHYYKIGTDNNIYLDSDGLISCGNKTTQLTWMDAQTHMGPVTPRAGKTVEINAMWYNALKIMAKFCDIIGENKKEYINLADTCKKSFEKDFYNENKKYLYDVLGDDKIRPNALFATSLSFPIITNEKAKEIFFTAKRELITAKGLKTLSEKELGYSPKYEGDNIKRDLSYHQGTVWPWLLGIYYDTLNNIYKFEEDKLEKERFQREIRDFKKYVKENTKTLLQEACINSISEIYDAEEPQLPKGCFAQGWSVAEILRIITE